MATKKLFLCEKYMKMYKAIRVSSENERRRLLQYFMEGKRVAFLEQSLHKRFKAMTSHILQN